MKYQNIYQERGYKSRNDYMRILADNYGLSISGVFLLADALGPNEDFDGLVTALEDYADEDDFGAGMERGEANG